MLKKETFKAMAGVVAYCLLVLVLASVLTGCSTIGNAAKYCFQYPDHCR